MTFDDYCRETGHYAEGGDRDLWNAATKAEREACAKVADGFYGHIRQYTTDVPNIGEAIRLRSDKG